MEINSDESKKIEKSESINTQPKLINNSELLSFLSLIGDKIFTHQLIINADHSKELKFYKTMKVKSMLKNFNNIVDMKIMYNSLWFKELNQVILKLLHLTENEHDEQKEKSIFNITIVPNSFEELKLKTSDYISFTHCKQNEPLITDQIHFFVIN